MKFTHILLFSVIALAGAGCASYQPRPLAPADTAAGLEVRSLGDPALRDFLATNLHREFPGWPLARWDLDALTLAAFHFHPDLEVARAQWHVAEAGVGTAGGRPNPVLAVTPGYSMNPAAGVSPWFPSVTLDVPIETAGKRGYRIAQAQNLSQSARLNIASAAWQIRSNLRASLLDEFTAQRRVELLRKQTRVQEQMVTLLEQRWQAGAVARSELAPARVALARSEAELGDAVRQSAEARNRIAEALGLSSRGIEGVEFDFSATARSGMDEELTSADARRRALLGRADILAALSEFAASESALQLEVARQYPDVHLNPGYQFDQGEHKWSLGLSIELPVLNRNQGPIAEAMARREVAAARFVALQGKVIAGIDRALTARATALSQVAQQRHLAQLARDQVASIEGQFKAGAADKLDLAGAQLEAGVNDLAEFDAQTRLQHAIGALEDAVQRPIEAIKSSVIEQPRPQAGKETKL